MSMAPAMERSCCCRLTRAWNTARETSSRTPIPPTRTSSSSWRLKAITRASRFNTAWRRSISAPYAGRLPLIVKLNGKTEIPSDAESFSSCNASVEDAVALGADAVGYTLYVGSPAQDRDFAQWAEVRRDAERLGIPTIIWAYPRGEAVEAKGGKESVWAIDYAARVATEMGADIVKINFPTHSPTSGLPQAV